MSKNNDTIYEGSRKNTRPQKKKKEYIDIILHQHKIIRYASQKTDIMTDSSFSVHCFDYSYHIISKKMKKINK